MISSFDDNNRLVYRKEFMNHILWNELSPHNSMVYQYNNDTLIAELLYIHNSPTQDSTLSRIDSTVWVNDSEKYYYYYELEDTTFKLYKKGYSYIDDTLFIRSEESLHDNAWAWLNYSEYHMTNSGSLYYMFSYFKNEISGDSTAQEGRYWYKGDGHTIDSNLLSIAYPPTISVMTDFRKTYYYYTDVTRIEEPSTDLNIIYAYPNPTNDICRIEFTPDKITYLSIYDIRGRLLDELIINHEDHYYLDLSQFNKGPLLIHVINKRTKSSIKLIKQ